MLPVRKDISGRHIIRKEPDLYLLRNELHGHIIIDAVNRDGGIPVNPADNTVHEAFVQPGFGLGGLYLHAGAAISFQWNFPDPGVIGCIVGPDIVCQKTIEGFQGMNRIQIKGIKPGFLQGSPLPFNFGLVMYIFT